MSLEDQMREFVKRLSLPLEVAYVPDHSNPRHGEIKNGVILIYDSDEEAAWITLLHETMEYRLKGLITPYRRLVNALIGVLEEEVYREKEKVLGQVLQDFVVWKEYGISPTPTKAKRSESIETA